MATTRAIIDVSINTSDAAAQIRNLQTQINAFNATLQKTNTVQALTAKSLTQNLLDAVNASRSFTAEQVRMETSARRLDQTLTKGQGTLAQYFNARFRKDSAEAAAVLSLANARAQALETQFIKTTSATNGFRDAVAIRPLAAFNDSTAVANERLTIHRAMLRQATTSMINFGKNTQWAGRQLMVGFTVPLTIFGTTAGRTFKEIDQAAVRFKKVYGDAFTPPEEIQKNMDAVKGLAAEFTKYGIAVKDTLDLAAEAAAAGAKNADLIAATTEATRLGTLGQLEQQEALTATIALQNAFKLSSVQLREEVNFLNMVENQTVVTLQDLTEAIPRVAPVIVGLGGDVRDLAAMMAAMQEGGVSAAQGANALKSGLGSLINPSRKASEELAKMGISIDSIVQANRGDLMGTVKAFGEALSGLDQFTRQQALEELFGKYQYARLGALFDNIIKDGTQASRVLQISGMSARDMAASAEKELSAISEATSTKFLAAIERFKLSIAPVGEMFMKLATPIVNFFAMLAEKFNSLPDFAKNLAGIATVFIGVVIPAGTMFLGLLMNLIGTLSKFGSMFTSAFQGMRQGGIGGGIRAISQSLNYMGLQEMDAANAATQLGQSTSLANDALVNQVSAAQDAEAAIKLLTDAYQMLIEKQMSVAQLSTSLFGAGASAASAAAGRAAQSPPTVEEQLSLFDVQGRNRGGRIFTLNSGNRVPGSGNTDTVPAMLTPGEFVVNKQATQQNLPLLQAINNGNKVSGFNKGGKIPGVQYFGTPGSPGGPVRFSDLEQRMAHEKEIAARLGMRQPISQASMANPNPGQASDYVLLSSVDNPTVLRTISDRMAAYFGTTVLGSYGSNVGLAPGKSGSDINRDLKFGRASAVDVQQMTGLVDYYLGTFRDVPAAAMALAGLGLTPLQGAEKISSALSSRIGKIRSKVLIGDADLWEETRLAYSAAGLDPLFAALETERGAIRYALPQEISASLRGGGQDDTIHGAALESVFGAGNISRTRDSSGRLIYVISGSAVGYPQNIGVRPGLTESMPSGGFNYENISKSVPGLTRVHMAPPQALNKGGLAGIQYFGTQDGNAGGGQVSLFAGDPAHSRFEVEVYADDGSVIGSVLTRGNMSDILIEYFNGIDDEAERRTAFDTIKRHASTLTRKDRQYSKTLEQSHDISILNSLLTRKIQQREASHFAHMTQRRGEFVSRYGVETSPATNLRLNEGGTTGQQWLDDTYPGEIIKTGFQRHILNNAGVPEDQINAASEEIDKKIITFLKNYKDAIFTDSGRDVNGKKTYEVGKMISPQVDSVLKKYNVSDTRISDLKTRNVRRRTKAQKRAQSAAQIQELMSGGPVNAVTAAAQQLQMYGYNSLTNEQKAILKGASEDVGSMPLFKGSSLLSPNIPSSLRDAIMSGNPDSLIGSIIQTPMGSYSESESIAAPFMYDNGETRRLKEIYQELFKSSYMIKDKNGKFVKPKTGKEALEARRLEMTTLPFHLDDPSYTDDDRIRINSERKGYPPSLYYSETPRLEKLAEEYDQLLAMGGGKGVIYRIKPGSSDLPPGQSKITDISTDKNVTTVTLETGKLLATPVSKLGGTPVMPGGTDLLRDEKEWHVGSFNNGGLIPGIQHFANAGQVLNYGKTSSMRAGLPLAMAGRRQRVLVDLDSTIFDNPGGNLWKLKPEDFIGIQRNIDRVHELRANGIDVEFVTARPPQLTELTQETLKRFGLNDIPVTYNDMKTPGKRDPSKMVAMPAPEYKVAVAKKRMAEGYDVSLLDDDENNRRLMAENGIYAFFNKGGMIPGLQYFANAGIVKRLMNSGLDRGQLQRKLVSDNQWDDLDDDLKRQVMEWDAAGNTGFGIFGAAYRARSQQQGDREAAKKAERQSGAYLPLKTLAMTDLDFGDADGVLRLMRSGELDEADQAFLIDYIKEGLDYGRLKDFHTQARQYHGQYYDTAMSSLVAEAQKIGNPKLIEALVRLTGVQAKNTGGLIPGVQYFGTQMPGRVVKEVEEQLALFGSSTPIVAKSKEDELNDIVEHFSTTVMRGGSKVQLHTFLKKWGKGGEAVLQYIKMNPAFFQHNPRGVDPDAPFRSGPQGELFGVTRFSGTGLHSFAATESGLIDDLISYVMKQENIPYFKYDPGPSGTSAGGLRLVDRLLDEGIIKDSLARDLASGNVNKLTREDALMMIENARQIGLLPETRQIITNKNSGGLIQFFKNGGDVAAMKAFATKPLFESRKRTRVPGSGNTDTVPAALTPGEFVINKKATQENLPLLQAINNGKIARAFTGGEITNDGVNTTSMPPLPAGMNPKAVKSRESTGVGMQPQSRISQGILAADTSDVLAVTPEEYRSYMPIIYPNVPPDVMAKLIEINIEKIFKDGRVRLGATTGTMTPDRVNPEELAFSISRSDVYEDQLSEEDKGRVFNEKSRIVRAFGEGPSSLQQHDVLTHNPYTQLFEIVHAKRLKSIYNELLAANSEHVAGLSFQDFIKKVVGKGGLSSTVVGSAIAKAELDQPFIRAVNEAYARIAYGLSPEDEIPLFRASTGTGGQIVSSLYKEANPGREATARQELLSTGERLTTGWWTYSPSLASSFVESPTGFPLLTTNVKVRDLPQIFNSSGYADERGMVFNAREDQRARFAFEEDRAALIEIDKLHAELKSGVSREREGAITARVDQLKSEISKRQGKSDNGKSPRGFDLREVLRPVMIPFSATQSPEAQIKMSEWRKAKPDTGRPGGVIKFDQASGSYYVDFSYLGVNKLSNSELLLVDLLQDGLGLNLLEMIMPDGTFKPVKLNNGNMVPGFGNGDTVPAMLTPGEFVVNKQATQKNLGLLHAINNGNPIMANRGGRIGINYLQTGGEAEQLAFQFDGSLQAAAEASDQMAISVREVTKGLNKYRDLIPDDVTKAAVEKNDTEEKASEESPGQMSLFNMPPPSQAVTQISEQLDLFSDEDIKKMQEDAQKAREDAIVAMIKLEGDFDKQRTQALEQYNNQRLQIETQFLENVRTIEEQGAREAAKRQADIAANKKSIDEATDENAKRGLQERLALLELEQSQHEQTMETRKQQAAQDRENSLKRAEQDQADTQRLINLADEQASALDEMTIGGESITGLKKRFKEASLKQKTTIGLGAATTLVGGASLAASQFGGAFGIDTKGFTEVTGKVTEGLGLMTTAASMLPGPAGLVAAAIVGVGYALKAVTDNANKMAAEAAKAGANLGATADSLKIVSAMLGTETPIQRMAKLRTGLTPQISKQLSENEKYQSMIGSEQGKKFLEELKNTTSEERMKKVGDMIAYGIASGAMTKEDATLFGKGIAAELNDPALAAQIGRNIAKQIEGSKGISQLGDQRSIALTQTKILEKATAKIQDPLIQFSQMQRSFMDDFMNSSFMNIAQFTPVGSSMKVGYSIGAALPAPGEIGGINAEDSAKYISGALQAIQDYSNAIALAKEELTSGKISQTEYNSIVADASGKIKELENGMQTAGLASENIGTTMGAVMTQLVDSGALTEEQFKNLEAAANATGIGFDDSRALVLSSLSAMAGGAMDAATALDLIAQISGTGLYEGQETAAKKYFDKTKGQLGAAQAQSGALVASQIESGALINPDILKKLGRGNQDKGSQQIIDFLQKLQTGVPNFDVTAFQDFYSKINDKNMVKIQPIIQNLKPEEVQAFMTQFNTAASYYGDDFANKLLTSPQTIAAAKEGGGAFQRAIGQAAEAGVKQTVVEALFVQNGRPRPWKDIEKDLKSYATYQKNIDKLPEEIRKVLKIDTEDPADVLKYGKTDMATIEANWTLLDKLPNNINKQAVASFIMTDETGKARSAQEVIKKIVDVEKWYGKLSKKGVNKIQTGIQIIQTMVDQEGNSIGNTPEEIKNNAQALVAELKNVYGAGKINKLPPEVYIATLQLKVNLQGIDEMIKAKRVLYNIAVGDGNFEEAKKISDELKNLVAQRNAIQSEIDLNMSRDYKQSGGGGGGAKSLLQQLKDNIKMFKEYFNNLKKLINDNRNLRFVNQDILNVPFSNDFLKYLTDNMEEANKIFKKGTDGIKKLYDAFVQDQLAQSKVYTMMLRNQNVAETDAINAKRKFTQELIALGITNPDILSTILESVNEETLKLRNKGLARKNPKKRTTQEQDAIDIVNQALVGQRQESVARSVATINTELDNQATSLNRVNGLLSLNSQLSQYGARVTLEQAQMLSEMGVTVDQVTANMVEFASIMERANAIKFAESIQQANDGLEKMRDQATRTKNVTKALGEDVNTELIQSLTSAMEADPNPNSWDANRIKQYADAWKYAQQQIEGAKDRFTQAIELSDALTKSFQQQIEKINRLEIKPIEKSIKALEDSIEPIQNEIEALQDKETELQKVYDERIKALEQVETINQRIIDQQKGQLDIASALSRGDIAAAAQATLSLQGTMAQQRSGELKDALSQQLEDERLSIETQIEEKQKQIEKINESIKNKQKEIEKIKERQLALEEKMYQLELLRSAIEIKRAMQNAGDLKQREEYLANQESLNAMNAIGFDSSLFGENAGKLGAAWNAIIASAAIPYEKYTSPLGSTMGVTSASVPMTTTLPTSASVVNITARSVIIGSGKQTDGEGDGTGLTNTPGDVAGNTYGDTGSNEFGGKIQNPIQIIKLFISNIKKSLAILTDKDLGLIKIFKDAIEVFASKDQAGKAKVGIREIFETLLKTIADVHNAFIRAARETLNKVKITLPETIINVKLNKTTVTIAEQILPIKVPEIQTFAMGGNVNYKGSKERAPGLAFGSFVPGMGNTDKVPAMLTPGEFVVRKSVAQAYGSQLEALNGQVNPQAGSSVYPGVPTRYRSNGIDSLVSVGSLSSFNPFTDLSNVDTSIVDLSRVNANTFPVITNVSSDSYPVDASYSNSQNVLNSFSPVQYTYNVSVNAETNANPDQIARAVVTQINSRDRRNIRGTKING